MEDYNQEIIRRLSNLERYLIHMDMEGINSKIHVDISLDGYELVKRNLKDKKENPWKENLQTILNTLTERECQSIKHRLGIDTKAKTFEQIGKVLGISRETSRRLYCKTIRKLRHPSKREMIKQCSHRKLRKEVLGES